MPLQNLRDKFPITDPATGLPTTYFMRVLQDTNQFAEDTSEEVEGKADASISIIAGAGLDGGGTLTGDVTLAVDVQEVLDSLSSTHGDILFRGASGWAVLGVGTAGQLLQTNGVAADPQWVTPSGGGGGSILPVVDGSVPPNLVYEEDGSLVYVEI